MSRTVMPCAYRLMIMSDADSLADLYFGCRKRDSNPHALSDKCF